jgi:hypothetical protein
VIAAGRAAMMMTAEVVAEAEAEVAVVVVAVAVAADEAAEADAKVATTVSVVKFLISVATLVKASPLTEVYWG